MLAMDRVDAAMFARTFPTAASPRSTSLTLLLGFGADAAAESVIEVEVDEGGWLARRLRPTPYADTLDGD